MEFGFDRPMKAIPQKHCARRLILSLLVLIIVAALASIWALFSFFYPWALQATLQGHQGGVLCLAFSPDGQTLATGGEDGTVRIWDWASGKERVRLTGHTARVVAMDFSNDGTLLATASCDGSVRLWEVELGKQRSTLFSRARPDRKGRLLPVLTVAFSPDGQFLASGGDDEMVTIWEVETGRPHAMLQHTESVCSLAFTADSKLIVSRTTVGIITVWELDGGKELRRFGERLGRDRFYRLALGPDGKTLACNNGTKEKVRLWDVATGVRLATLRADQVWQDWPVNCMAFSPDGKVVIATTMFGAKMVFWDESTGELLGTIHFPPKVSFIAFSPDGKTLASAHLDGTVKLWDSAKLIGQR